MAHERVGGDDCELIANGEVDGPCRRVEVEGVELVAGADVPELGGLVGAAGDEADGVAGDVAGPNGAVVAAVGAETLAIVGEPDSGGVVLRAGEEEIAFTVVLEERQWPLVAFHQNRPHLLPLLLLTSSSSSSSSFFLLLLPLLPLLLLLQWRTI